MRPRCSFTRPPLALLLTACLLALTPAPSVAQTASGKTVVLTAPYTDARTLCGGEYCVVSADKDTGLMQVEFVEENGEALAGIQATHKLGKVRSLKYRATFEVEMLSAPNEAVSVGMSHTTSNLGGWWFLSQCWNTLGGSSATRELTSFDKEVSLEWTVPNPGNGTQYLSACRRVGSGITLADVTLTRIEAIVGA